MDNAMVKRGIGAIVLAVIAALLLGYLLKDKSSQRQEVVDMKLPGAPEMNIPSLTGSSDTDTETTSTLLAASKDRLDSSVSSISDKAKGAGVAIIASAEGVKETVADAIKPTVQPTMDSTSAAIQGTKPGFAIRPSLPNEQKEIVDNTDTTTTAPKIEKTTKTVKDSVVATTKKVTKAFKPEIVEKKKPAKPSAPKQAKAPKQNKAPSKPEKTESSAPIPSTAPAGKYSIQLLATSSQSRAGKLAKTMKSEGYNVFVTQTTRDNKVLYRVRVGGHSSRNSAIQAQEGMKKRYQKNFFVQNSLVISN
ncbi:MAG: SPOR domain-containing protein [Cocleimonas sp.]|nr:SPOR domain-containing protein [Cocleimonas sp.]